MTANQIIREFFEKFPLEIVNPPKEWANIYPLPDAEFFMAYLWLRGLKVVPIEENVE